MAVFGHRGLLSVVVPEPRGIAIDVPGVLRGRIGVCARYLARWGRIITTVAVRASA